MSLTVVYASVPERVKAALVDTLLLVAFLMCCSFIFSKMGQVPDSAKMVALGFAFLLYDPLFISLFGGTIGHKMIGVRVKKANKPESNLSFPVAVIRFLLKVLLGFPSLLIAWSNEERKTIHDYLVNSVVIYV